MSHMSITKHKKKTQKKSLFLITRSTRCGSRTGTAPANKIHWSHSG